jgi:ceramide glucosyltransferase
VGKEVAMTGIFGALVALAAVSLVLSLAGHVSAHLVLGRKAPTGGPLPPISILKPLKGMDDGLYENLASIAQQDYPQFEVLFAAEDADDPALDVARAVARAFPTVDISIHVLPGGMGRNPKVKLLSGLLPHARHELLLISDSNVRARPGYLRAMASELTDPAVGLVTSVLCGKGDASLGARLENLHLNSGIVGAVCGADVLVGHPCSIGKSMLFRRHDLERVGGFARLRNVLAEDYVLGRSFEKAGFKVVLSPYVLATLNQQWTLERFLSRHLRWSLMRRRLLPSVYLGEPLFNPLPLLGLVGAVGLFTSHPLVAAAAAIGLVVRSASDLILAARLRGDRPRASDLALIPFKDLLIGGVWAVAWFRRTVDWRGNRLRVGPGSLLLATRKPSPTATATPIAASELVTHAAREAA